MLYGLIYFVALLLRYLEKGLLLLLVPWSWPLYFSWWETYITSHQWLKVWIHNIKQDCCICQHTYLPTYLSSSSFPRRLTAFFNTDDDISLSSMEAYVICACITREWNWVLCEKEKNSTNDLLSPFQYTTALHLVHPHFGDNQFRTIIRHLDTHERTCMHI